MPTNSCITSEINAKETVTYSLNTRKGHNIYSWAIKINRWLDLCHSKALAKFKRDPKRNVDANVDYNRVKSLASLKFLGTQLKQIRDTLKVNQRSLKCFKCCRSILYKTQYVLPTKKYLFHFDTN